MRELESNVALRVPIPIRADTFEVRGRGELHLSILIETMRREGYELAVSKPQVIVTERDGERWEPVEYVVVDVPEEYAGAVIEALGSRKAVMSNMFDVAESRRLEYTMPTRAIFGFRGELLTLTRGTAVMSHTYYDHQALAGRASRAQCRSAGRERYRTHDRLCLMGVEQRGRFFVGPGVDVYEGMVVGRANDDKDVALNVVREKKLTNMRAAGSDENVKLAPPEDLRSSAPSSSSPTTSWWRLRPNPFVCASAYSWKPIACACANAGLPLGRSAELAAEIVNGRAVGLEPRRVAQKTVNLVGDHDLLERHAREPQPRDEVNHLMELDVAVVVALNQQHRRFPRSDSRVG